MEMGAMKSRFAAGAVATLMVAAGASHPVTASDAAYKVDPDPTGGRSIIIECVVLGGLAAPNASDSQDALKVRSVSLPPHQLGPSKCWADEYDEPAIGVAAECAGTPIH